MKWYGLWFQQQLCDLDYILQKWSDLKVILGTVNWAKYVSNNSEVIWKGWPNEVSFSEYELNTSEVIWNTISQCEKCGIRFQQQWGDMECKFVMWGVINNKQLRWASRWAKSEKNKGTTRWGEMDYRSELSRWGEMEYNLIRWSDLEDFPSLYLNLKITQYVCYLIFVR